MVEKVEYRQEKSIIKDLQLKLKTNELKYKFLIENLPQKIFLKDENSVYISCNNNLAQDLGISVEEITGKTDYDFFPKELAEKYREDDKRIMMLGETEDIEEYYMYNGKKVYVHTVKTPIKDDNNSIMGLIGIFWDITERHKIFEKLVESEYNLLERVKELTCLYELSKLLENPNNSIEDHIRGTLKLIQSSMKFPLITCARIFHYKREFKTDNFKETKWKLSNKTGIHEKDFVVEVFYREDNPFLKEEEYLIDEIGNRLRSFLEQKELEEKYRFLFETSPNSIFLMSMDGKVRDCNPKGEELFGYTRKELVGKPFMKFSWFLPETMPLVIKTFKLLTNGEIPEPIELQQRRKDGTLIWVYVLFSFLKIGKEKLIQVITQDISRIKETEQKLRDNEEKFRKMTSSAQDAILQMNHNGEIVYWNKSAESIFGYSSKDILSKDITLIIPERFRERFKARLSETMNSLGKFSKGRIIEVKGLRKDGTEFSTELSFSVFDLNGKKNSISIIRDITERKLYEEQLQQTHNQLDQIFNASIPMYVTDKDYNIIKLNKRFAQTFQVDSDKIIGKKCYDVWRCLFCHTEKCPSTQINKGVEQYDIEIEKILSDGTKANFIIKANPYLNQDNKLIGCIKTYTDITERTKTEQKLKDSEEKYRSVLENIKEGYFEIDIKGNLTFVNEGMCEIFNYTRDELLKSHYNKFFDDQNKKLVFNVYNSLYKAGEGFTIFDCEVIKKDYEKIHVESSAYLRYSKNGNIIGFKGFLRNITERKQAEALQKGFNNILEKEVVKRTEELKSTLEKQKLYLDQILKASHFKTEFLATMSHELRTPLNAIIGFTDLLLGGNYGPINGEQVGFLEDIKNSAEHQYEMIKNILDISKIESGQVSIKIEKIQLKDIIQQIISALKPLYSESKINMKIKGLNKNTHLFADRIKFKQVIYNLLSNALKFTEKGTITLEFKDKSNNWEFDVKDTGIGIAEEDFELIFKDFKRVKSTYVNSKPGTGLGLALTKRIVNLHGGDISFTSQFGKGSTFTFTIPKNFEINNIKKV